MVQPAIVSDVRVDDDLLTFVLTDGREVSCPTEWSERLTGATPEQRARFEIESEGLIVEWPDLDEHVGVWSLLGVSEEDAFAAAGIPVLQTVSH